VAVLRKAIGDDPDEPRWLRTVHGFGYAWSGAVEGDEVPPPAARIGCTLGWGQREIPLRAGENLLGRAPDATLRLRDERVSRQHARILVLGETVTLEDLGSRNGTFHRGERVTAPVTLADGDELRLGHNTVVVRIYPAEGSTVTNLEA
jgi:hypothetical protein